MDVVYRGSEKYFLMMLYRLFFADHFKIEKGNANSMYC